MEVLSILVAIPAVLYVLAMMASEIDNINAKSVVWSEKTIANMKKPTELPDDYITNEELDTLLRGDQMKELDLFDIPSSYDPIAEGLKELFAPKTQEQRDADARSRHAAYTTVELTEEGDYYHEEDYI